MKKLLTILLAAAMLVVAPATIFADEDNIQELGTDDASGTIELEATISSSYTLKLPLKVDVSSNSSTCDIYAKGDVDGSKTIVISEDNAGENVLEDGADLKADKALTVTFGTGIAGSDITSDYGSAKETITIVHDTLQAGSWTCSLPILIKLS